MRLSNLKYKKAFIILLSLLCIGNTVASGLLARIQKPLQLGDLSLPTSSLNGCLQALSFSFCLLMVMIDYNFGLVCSLIVISVSIVGAGQAIVRSSSLLAIPTIINSIFYIAALIIISGQFRQSKRAELTDKLTGQINRYGFEEIIHKKIRSFEKGTIIFLHIKGFTDINTNLGRSNGDIILKTVSDRIGQVIVGKGEAYKLEGAEFAIFIREGNDCEELVKTLIAIIEEKIEVKIGETTSNVYVNVKAGIADCLNGYVNPDTLMKNADIAMTYAMRNEDIKYCFYNERIKKGSEREHEIEGYIKDALEKDYFYLVFQPQFAITNKKLRGFETLIRMKLTDGTMISPAEFISVAEKSDLILRIDDFVMRKAMKEFKDTCLEYDKSFILSINISAKDIALDGFAEKLIEVADSIGFPKECLEIEITEYSFAKSAEATIGNIKKLRESGVMIALDDFGTGYTSLSQLLNLPINLLKIDKSLVDSIKSNDTNKDFINAVIYMGHLMECEVIAEGVEDEDQLSLLHKLGCDFVQGFVWGKPTDYDSVVLICRQSV